MTNTSTEAGLTRAVMWGWIVGILAAAGVAFAGPETWIEITPEGESLPERNAAAGAYDPATNRMILFGGRVSNGSFANDVWLLSQANGLGGSAAWIPLSPGGDELPGLAEHSAVYDPGSNHLIVFGGQSVNGLSNDVWVVSGANGTGGFPLAARLPVIGTRPSARVENSAIYDSASNRMIVYGGHAGAQGLNDVWVLTGANGQREDPSWIQLLPEGTGPVPGFFNDAVYDSEANRMIVLQRGVVSPFDNALWILTHANGLGGTPLWIALEPDGPSPGPRARPAMVWDPMTERLILFGGQNQGVYLNDLWGVTAANGLAGPSSWIELAPAGTPPRGRDMAVTGYDPRVNRLILVGGQALSPFNFLNDSWVLANANGVFVDAADLVFPNGATLTWPPVSDALSYDVYRGRLADLTDDDGDGLSDEGYGTCANLMDPWAWDNLFTDEQVPSDGSAFFYLVSSVDAQGPGGVGTTSSGLIREPFVPCSR